MELRKNSSNTHSVFTIFPLLKHHLSCLTFFSWAFAYWINHLWVLHVNSETSRGREMQEPCYYFSFGQTQLTPRCCFSLFYFSLHLPSILWDLQTSYLPEKCSLPLPNFQTTFFQNQALWLLWKLKIETPLMAYKKVFTPSTYI